MSDPFDQRNSMGMLLPAPSEPKKTLRDEFAMAAMQGLLASGRAGHIHEAVAAQAVRYADALLKELKR